MTLLAVVFPGLVAMGHGGEIDVIVEVASGGEGFEYGLAVQWTDGDPVSGAHVVLTATLDDLIEVTEPVEVSPGEYVGQLLLSEPGGWDVDVTIHHPDSNGEIRFLQEVTSTSEAQWVVLADTADPDRVGSTPDPENSILALPAPTPTTTPTPRNDTTVPESEPGDENPAGAVTATTSAPEPVPIASDIVIDLTASNAPNPARDISIRVGHIVAIGLWLIPVGAGLLGHTNRKSVIAAVAGVILTLSTGAILMIWGTPIDAPGILNWSELSDIPHGTAYLTAFTVKISAVLLGAVATIRWAMKADSKAAWSTLATAAIAVVAVTAMSQYHVLSHT